MGIPTPICLFFIVICSLVSVSYSQTGGGGGGGSTLPCVQKLMPCQPYLKGSPAPPATCCVPLKEIVTDDSQCLCAVFNNPALLKSLNVTQQDALNLAKSCGANADTSVCKKAAAPTGSSPNPSTPTANNGSSASPPTKSSANIRLVSHVGRSLNLAAISGIIIVSAF